MGTRKKRMPGRYIYGDVFEDEHGVLYMLVCIGMENHGDHNYTAIKLIYLCTGNRYTDRTMLLDGKKDYLTVKDMNYLMGSATAKKPVLRYIGHMDEMIPIIEEHFICNSEEK